MRCDNVLWSVRQKDDASLFVIKDYGADGSDRLDREWAFLTSLARYKIADAPAQFGWIGTEVWHVSAILMAESLGLKI